MPPAPKPDQSAPAAVSATGVEVPIPDGTATPGRRPATC